MGAFSDYLEDKILGWLRGTGMPAAPASVYVGLLTAAPGDTGSGGAPSDGTEVSGGSYARVAITTTTDWNAIATSGTTRHMTTNKALNFPTPTASWGTVVAVGVWDASTAGNLLFWTSIAPTQTISSGNTVTIASGALDVSVD